jgi:hypothetical protein
VEADRFAAQQREEQVRLVADHQPGHARLVRAWAAVKATAPTAISGSAPSVLGCVMEVVAVFPAHRTMPLL